MVKCKAIYLLVTVAFFIGVAPAQKSQVHSSTAKSNADYSAATKPLTPKSAMPAKHSSSSAMPPASKRNVDANKELTHLERPQVRAGVSSKTGASAAKSSSPKPAAAAKDSGINATYEKPKPGMQASRPDAHAANSIKPRVTKN
ncbi:MAG: hypothetical protein ABSB14_13155 [Candidatus Sulfotelmatobacter sp.]|jgi:hypothetical protein